MIFIQRWRDFTPFYFYIAVAAIMGLSAMGGYQLGRALLMMAIGLVSWFFVEYFLHRVIFHYDAESEAGRAFVHRMHLAHHEAPKDLTELFSGLRTSVPIAIIYFLLVWLITFNWQTASFVFIGMVFGYLAYELLHYQAHHSTPKSRILQYLKKYHMLHHHKTPKQRYGVTTPFIDYLFGTFEPVKKR